MALETSLQRLVNQGLFTLLGIDRHVDPLAEFHCNEYRRLNEARLAHLESLHLDIDGCTVLDLGGGIGDHVPYYLARGCKVTLADARPGNIAIAAQRFPDIRTCLFDANIDTDTSGGPFEVVHCYGLLYHLVDPLHALDVINRTCTKLLILESAVSQGKGGHPLHPLRENKGNPSQAFTGIGCRPERAFLFQELRKRFPYVYIPRMQPRHPDFPLKWPLHIHRKARNVFVASRIPLTHELLSPSLPDYQCTHV